MTKKKTPDCIIRGLQVVCKECGHKGEMVIVLGIISKEKWDAFQEKLKGEAAQK